MKEIKHFIANILRKNKLTDSFIYKILLLVNNVLFHRKERFMLKKYGEKNPSCIFYVIRNNSLEEGLLSIYFNVLSEIEYALGKGYIPYVDLQNNITQYTTGELVNGTRNAWEYFWKQPSQYRMEDIYQSKNVILCGKNRKVDKEKRLGKMNKLIREYDFSDIESTHELYCFIKEYAEVMPYIYEKVNSIWKLSFQDNKVIGVFIRGTDYVAFSPKGHSIQPTKEYIYEQLMILRKKYSDAKIFLVTEDDMIYQFFKERLNDNLIEIDDIRFVKYKNDDYIYKYCKNNTYEIGLKYLVKLLLLSRCNYLVASKTNGSKFANIMNDNNYEERIIIDLGVYE